MSARLYRSGGAWVVRALGVHTFQSAKEARQWAKANCLRLIRSDKSDRDHWGRLKG